MDKYTIDDYIEDATKDRLYSKVNFSCETIYGHYQVTCDRSPLYERRGKFNYRTTANDISMALMENIRIQKFIENLPDEVLNPFIDIDLHTKQSVNKGWCHINLFGEVYVSLQRDNDIFYIRRIYREDELGFLYVEVPYEISTRKDIIPLGDFIEKWGKYSERFMDLYQKAKSKLTENQSILAFNNIIPLSGSAGLLITEGTKIIKIITLVRS